MNERTTFALTIPDDAWWDTEGDGTRLLATLNINGTLHHLEAIRVIARESGVQDADSDLFRPALSALYDYGGDGVFETTAIRGASYVIAAMPFQ